MNYKDFQRSLSKNKKVEPFYLLSGKEAFRKAEAISLLKSCLGEDTVFVKEYQGNTATKMDDIVAELYSKPLFEEWNLLVLHDADALLANLYEPLLQYLERPAADAILVVDVADLDQRTRFAKWVKEHGVVVECEPFKEQKSYARAGDSEVTQWLSGRAAHYQKKISDDACRTLQQLVGSGMGDLDSQVEKLALFVEGRPNIEVADVQALVSQSKRTNIFELLDAVFNMQPRTALPLCAQLFQRGSIGQGGELVTDHMGIALQCLRLIQYRLRQLWKFSIANDTSGIPPFIQRSLKEQASHFPLGKLVAVWEKLGETEFSLKSSPQKPWFAIELLILFICRK
jgi:DNA polymerase III delta subunit